MTPHDLSGDPRVSETKQDWATKEAGRRLLECLRNNTDPLEAFAQALRDEREACAREAEVEATYAADIETAVIIGRAIRNREDKP